MLRYEILMLAVPTITQDETKSIESGLDRVFKEGDGTMVSFERWGKYRLAYPVKKNDYGVYFLARFEADDAHKLLEDIKPLFKVKLHEVVMRHIVTALDPEKSLVYQRPQSLEDTPVRERDDVLNKRKIERILSSTKSRSSDEKKPEEKSEKVVEEVAEKVVEEAVEKVKAES